MLLSFTNIVLLSIRWFCDVWRQNRYMNTMSKVLNKTSLLLQRYQIGRITKYETCAIFKASVPLQENEMITSAKKFLMKDDFLMMHEMKSWARIDLSTWVGYNPGKGHHQLLPPPTPSPGTLRLQAVDDKSYVLVEAQRRDQSVDGERSATSIISNNSNTGCDLSYHVLNFGTPIAWRSSEPFAAIMSCDSVDSFVEMVDAFGQNRLVVSDELDVVGIATVKICGSPQALSLTEEIFSPAVSVETHSLAKNSAPEESNTAENSSLIHPKSLSPPNTTPSSSSSHSHSNSSSSSRVRNKPPNILVYCGIKDTTRKFEEALESLKNCVNTDSYTIYLLKQEHILSSPWQENAAALIISGCIRLPSEVKQKVCDYVFNHRGNLISFGSSADSLFVNHLDIVKNEGSENITTFDFQDWNSVSCCCGPFVYMNCRENASKVVSVTNTKDRGDDAAHVVKLNLEKGGTVLLSQLFLEQDPVSQAKDRTSFDVLKKSNSARLSVLRELFTHMGLDTQQAAPPVLTHCHLMAQSQSLKKSFLSSLRLKDGMLKSKSISLMFSNNDTHDLTEPQPNLLPVLTYVDGKDDGTDNTTQKVAFNHFDMSDYWKHLKSSQLGRLVMYTDVIPSTMPVFDGMTFMLPKDMLPIAIAGRQVSGKGRSGNAWISPEGCAMFTVPLCLDLHSALGQRISFLQHLVALAVVRGVLTQPGYQDLDLRLKWPNDIYYGKEMKLGGVLVMSSVMGSTVYPTIGCGVNVANSDPTICINDIIHLRNTSNPDLSPLPPLTTAQVIALTLNCLEELLSDFETNGHDYVSKLYYKHWLHSGCKVTVDLKSKSEGEIVGLDEYGFLSIQTSDGSLISVQPDGNTFDMMHNLIRVKDVQ